MSGEKENQALAVLSERERQLLEQERIINAELDAKLLANHDKFPKAIYFILPNEFCERFCFYGIKGLLNMYLQSYFSFDPHYAKSQIHLFNGLVYLFPLFGAAASDSFLGKYHTIVYLSFVYLIGNALLSIFSIPYMINEPGKYQYFAYIIPAILIAIGTGGIKPCVSSHGGDQFLASQEKLLDRFFSFFYVSINVGALIAQYLTPALMKHVSCFGADRCYFLAYGVPTIFFAIALAVFMFGFRYYRVVPPQGEFLPWKALKVTFLALSRRSKATAEERASKKHWVYFAAEEYGDEFCNETRLLGKVIVMFIPIIFFWVLYDQNGTEWQNQYEIMDKLFLGIAEVDTEASSNINSFLIIIFVPMLSYLVYPPIEKLGYKFNLVRRMGWGFLLVILSFVISTSLEYSVQSSYAAATAAGTVKHDELGRVTKCVGCVNGTWQLAQYIVLSLGEAMLSPTGVQFAYTQVGRQMKASSTSIWLLAVAFGNYVVMAMELGMSQIKSSTTRNWIYVGIASFFFVIYVLLAQFWYVSKEDEDAARELEEQTTAEIKT